MAPRRAPSAPKTVDEYLARVPPPYRAMLLRIRRIVRATAPEAEERISYGMPAFRQNGMLVYYAAFSDHASLFVPSTPVRRRFAAELKPFLAGRGTVRFTAERPLPKRLVERIVRAMVKEKARRRAR